MRCSMVTTITSHNRPNISELEDEWRINNLLGRPTNGQSAGFSNFSYTHRLEVTKFENTLWQELGKSFQLIFKWF
jgi:hypothetical protein